MNTPEELARQMADKPEGRLQDMFERPEKWSPEELIAARAELRKRGLRPVGCTSKPTTIEQEYTSRIRTEELAGQMAQKTDQQLLDMLARPAYWTPKQLDAVKAEIQKRNIAHALDQELEAQIANRTNEQLLDRTRGGWLPETRDAARAELQKRNVTLPPPGPLTITVTTGPRTMLFCEGTVDATVTALRTEILQGTIPREAKTSIKFKTRSGKLNTWDGTLLKCALQHTPLASIYFPVRQHAFAGMRYGALAGPFVLQSSDTGYTG